MVTVFGSIPIILDTSSHFIVFSSVRRPIYFVLLFYLFVPGVSRVVWILRVFPVSGPLIPHSIIVEFVYGALIREYFPYLGLPKIGKF